MVKFYEIASKVIIYVIKSEFFISAGFTGVNNVSVLLENKEFQGEVAHDLIKLIRKGSRWSVVVIITI